MLRAWIIALTCLTTVFPAGRAGAEDEPAGTFAGRLQVTEVLVDVVAFDRRGEAVADLGLDDFVVREEGRPVELTGISFYTTWYDPAGEREAGGEHRAEIPSSRYFILFFHDPRHQRAQPIDAIPDMLRQQWRAGLDGRRWLAEDLQPSDWVAVVSYRGKLVLHQDFTQDRDALAEAIAAAAGSRRLALRPPSQRPRPPASGEAALRRALDRIDDLPRASARVEDALRLVAEAAGHVVGRKNLIVFTPGLGDPPRGGDGAGEAPFPALEHALNANNVALYAVDLGGPRPRGSEELVALGSGGAFAAGLRFRTILKRIARENRGYYVLSYRTELPVGEPGYRSIEVEARSKDVELRARRGFAYGG